MRVILASQSPRRRQLLEQIGLEFEILVPEADESFDSALPPEEIVRSISRKKAEAARDLAGDREACRALAEAAQAGDRDRAAACQKSFAPQRRGALRVWDKEDPLLQRL